MSIFLYILQSDSGFAPNPFHGYCTLACCKPKIRATAKPADWVMGITPKQLGHRLAYAMKVTEVLTFAEYFSDLRFRPKKPIWAPRSTLIQRCGDNCYRPLRGGSFEQLPSRHYDRAHGREHVQNKRTDLGGKHALISEDFAYFGASSRSVPTTFADLMPARFYRRIEADHPAADPLLRFLRRLPRGVHGPPRQWRSDEPWKDTPRCG